MAHTCFRCGCFVVKRRVCGAAVSSCARVAMAITPWGRGEGGKHGVPHGTARGNRLSPLLLQEREEEEEERAEPVALDISKHASRLAVKPIFRLVDHEVQVRPAVHLPLVQREQTGIPTMPQSDSSQGTCRMRLWRERESRAKEERARARSRERERERERERTRARNRESERERREGEKESERASERETCITHITH